MNKKVRKIFLAGIIQGSNSDKSIHPQDYRGRIRAILSDAFPEATVYDPFSGHENSVEYDDEKGEAVFRRSLDQMYESDLMVAYLPTASMGTAIEMWECRRRNIPVWTITGMPTNWIVRFYSDKVFEDIESFSRYIETTVIASAKER
jgi:nucleoside 2-deoxyribosyltransferase